MTRTSNSLDQIARTLLAEVQVPNPQWLLLPGMYTQVQFGDVRTTPPLLVPGDAVITTANGLQVAILEDLTPQDRERITRERQQQEQTNRSSSREQSADREQNQEQEYGNAKRIHLQAVQVGRDYGPEIEIASGLQGWEYVVVNPGDEIREGAVILPRAAPAVAGENAPQRRGTSDQQPAEIGAPSREAPTQGAPAGRGQKGGGQGSSNSGTQSKGKGGGKVNRRLLVAIAPVCLLAQAPAPSAPIGGHGGHWYDPLAAPYKAPYIPPVDLSNSQRIEGLLRAGNLYSSLPDAVSLALENNLDVAFERYEPRIASTDVTRAKGGGTLRGISLLVTEAPSGIGGPAAPLLNAAPTGTVPSGSVASNLTVLDAVTQSTSGISITGATPISLGPVVPLFDPVLTGSLLWQRQTTPELNNVTSGTATFVTRGLSGNLGVQQGFSTGTQLGLDFIANQQTTNAVNFRLNPYTQSNLGLTLTQPLLRGFGPSLNRRFIRIARNNQQTSDLVFRQQLIATVAGVIRLYDDLVSLGEDLNVKEQTLALAQRLYEDNRVQVQQGTLAPVELTRAQAAVAAAEQDLANSRGFELQQELIVKNVLTRSGTADPAVRDARVITTTPLEARPAMTP